MDPPLYEYSLCRLCLCDGQCLVDVFEENGEQGFIIKDAIEDLLQFEVSKVVGVPWCVCPVCLQKVTDFKRFKRQCMDSKIAFENRIHQTDCFIAEQLQATPTLTSLAPSNESVDVSHVKLEQPDVEIGQELYPQVILKTIEEEIEATTHSSFDDDTSGLLDLADAKDKLLDEQEDMVLELGIELAERKLGINNNNNNASSNNINNHHALLWKAIQQQQPLPLEDLELQQPQQVVPESVVSVTGTMGGKERPFPCADCSRSFANKSLLLIHRRTHTGERPYECLDCGKRFSKNNDLIRHRMTHTGEKPFKCFVCGKRFARNSHLVRHNRMHTGERPYECLDCGKCFSESGHLNQHKRRHAGLKPFKCSDCGKDFLEKSDLMRHAWIHKEESKHVCGMCHKEFTQNSSGEMAVKSLSLEAQIDWTCCIHEEESKHICNACHKDFTQNRHSGLLIGRLGVKIRVRRDMRSSKTDDEDDAAEGGGRDAEGGEVLKSAGRPEEVDSDGSGEPKRKRRKCKRERTPRSKEWDDTSVRLLISEYGSRFDKVGEDTERSTEENRRVWKEITRKLRKSGYSFSVKNARRKWDLLEDAYVNMASRNIHPGLKRTTCPYGRELTAILNPGGMKNYMQIEEEVQKELEKANEERRREEEDAGIEVVEGPDNNGNKCPVSCIVRNAMAQRGRERHSRLTSDAKSEAAQSSIESDSDVIAINSDESDDEPTILSSTRVEVPASMKPNVMIQKSANYVEFAQSEPVTRGLPGADQQPQSQSTPTEDMVLGIACQMYRHYAHHQHMTRSDSVVSVEEPTTQAEAPDQGCQVDQAEQGCQIDQPEQGCQVDQVEQVCQVDQPEHGCQVDQPEQSCQVDQPAQGCQPEKANHGESSSEAKESEGSSGGMLAPLQRIMERMIAERERKAALLEERNEIDRQRIALDQTRVRLMEHLISIVSQSRRNT